MSRPRVGRESAGDRQRLPVADRPRLLVADRPRLLVATRSAHKLRELRELLHLERGELVSLEDLDIPGDPEETGLTFRTNAAIKARFGARASGLPTLADDSGLEVDALDGGPGVRTRRYAGEHATDTDNNALLLRTLDGLPPERRGARYVCVLALAIPPAGGGAGAGAAGAGAGAGAAEAVDAGTGPRGSLLVVFTRGTCRGRIATEPRGTGGFGYDPIFEPRSEPPGGRTLGLWTPAEKHTISHRARAAARMAPRLAGLGF